MSTRSKRRDRCDPLHMPQPVEVPLAANSAQVLPTRRVLDDPTVSSAALAALLRSLLEGIVKLPARTAERCPVAAGRLQQLALAVGHRLAEQENTAGEQQHDLLCM